MELTGGEAYVEDDDDCKVLDPLKEFDDQWIEQQRESCFMVARTLSKHTGSPVVLDGLICKMCIGPIIYNYFEVDLAGDYNEEYMNKIQDYFLSVQWHFIDAVDTSTSLRIENPYNMDESLSISALKINDGKIVPFDYISYADLFAIFDLDDQSVAPVLIPFKEMWKTLPKGVFRPIDDWQYERVEEITVDQVREMMSVARRFQPNDLHYRPTLPGDGYDERQNTIVLMWNPAISSVKLEEHIHSIKHMLTENFNWSVWDYKKAKCGDRFFLVKVGEGNTGIVMSGVFDSNPYPAEDWSGKGRQTFYMDMIPDLILDPDNAPMISTKELKDVIPTFDWSGGHSGRVLSSEEAQAIELIWAKFKEEHADNIDGVHMNAINIDV